MFKEFRQILKGSNPEEMPFRIKMYTMDSIVLEKEFEQGAYGEVFKRTVQDKHFGEVIQRMSHSNSC